MKFYPLLFLFFITQIGFSQEKFTPEWNSLKQHNAAPEWFSDAKLGVYFHCGVYNVPANGNEWYGRWMYTPDNTKWGKDIYDYHTKTYGRDKHYHDFIPEWKAPKYADAAIVYKIEID